ncbi:MAG: hypothetical protein ACTHMC_03700, partial [Pseudobacter sp.]|uniref:hypothetical protein n=1 Tax=Pseudobacter sp. TaxID=2045420 RepID=UPI003F80CED9
MKKILVILLIVLASSYSHAQPVQIDPYFGNSGKIQLNVGFPYFDVTCSIVLKNGKTIVGGTAKDGINWFPRNDFFLARFNADGSIDNNFGTGGIQYVNIEDDWIDQLVKITELSNGNIVTLGQSKYTIWNSWAITLMSFLPDGSPDLSFNGSGKNNAVSITGAVSDMIVLPDGRMVVSTIQNASKQLFTYTRDGKTDNDFTFQQPAIQQEFHIQSLSLLRGGKILATGYNYQSGNPGNRVQLRCYQPSGKLDSSFAENGIMQYNVLSTDARFIQAAITPDSNSFYLAVHSYKRAIDRDTVVMTKHQLNGTADMGFGVNGVLDVPTTTNYFYQPWQNKFLVQADGKILFPGTAVNANGFEQPSAIRYNTNGSIDGSFGVNGQLAAIESGTNHETITTSIGPDGKIIMAGYALGTGRHQLAVARFLTNGVIDKSFGADGIASNYAGFGEAYDGIGMDMLQLPDKKILAVGITGNGSYSSIVLTRLNATGQPDPDFGTEGFTYMHLSEVHIQTMYYHELDSKMLTLKTDQQGNIYVLSGATSKFERKSGITLFRFTPSGQPDSSFARYGKKEIYLNEAYGRAPVGIGIQSNGKAIVALSTDKPEPKSSTNILIRFNTDGSIDKTFGNNGMIDEPGFIGQDYLETGRYRRLLIQPDDKIIFCGEPKGESNMFGIRRYNADGTNDQTFYQGYVLSFTVAPHYNNLLTAVGLQPNGKILLAGTSTEPGAGAVIVRCTKDGSRDYSFGENGICKVRSFGFTEILSICVQEDGRILLLKDFYDDDAANDKSYIKLIRLTRDGRADETFGYDGAHTIVTSGLTQETAGGMAIGENGQILICGGVNLGYDGVNYDHRSDLVIYGLNTQPTDCSIGIANAGNDTTICSGAGKFAIIGTYLSGHGITYEWSPATGLSSTNESRPVATPPPGTTQYALKVTNAFGCITHDTVKVTVNQTPPIPFLSQTGHTLLSSVASGNQWYLNNQLIPGATGASYIPLSPGEYSVIVTQNGCESKSFSPLTVITTGINSPELDKQLHIGP